MKFGFVALPLAAAFAMASSSTLAAETANAPFLPRTALDLAAMLPPPPPEVSEEAKAEFGMIHQAQNTATSEQKAQAVIDAKEDVFLFQDAVGPNFAAANLPAATLFFRAVAQTEAEFVDSAKQTFGRRRPPLVDATITPCQTSSSPAYPSGHATFGWLEAIVLSQMLPEKRDAIYRRAAEYGNHRVVCGVHFPSDVEAGKISAFDIAAALLQSPRFLRAFDTARSEVRKALALPVK
jgi:acid phosphatase (class A)